MRGATREFIRVYEVILERYHTKNELQANYASHAWTRTIMLYLNMGHFPTHNLRYGSTLRVTVVVGLYSKFNNIIKYGNA